MKLFTLLPVLFLATHPDFSQAPKTSQLPGTWKVVADQQVDRSGMVTMEDTNLRPEKAGTLYKRRFQLAGDTLYLRSTDLETLWQVKAVRGGGPPSKP